MKRKEKVGERWSARLQSRLQYSNRTTPRFRDATPPNTLLTPLSVSAREFAHPLMAANWKTEKKKENKWIIKNNWPWTFRGEIYSVVLTWCMMCSAGSTRGCIKWSCHNAFAPALTGPGRRGRGINLGSAPTRLQGILSSQKVEDSMKLEDLRCEYLSDIRY